MVIRFYVHSEMICDVEEDGESVGVSTTGVASVSFQNKKMTFNLVREHLILGWINDSVLSPVILEVKALIDLSASWISDQVDCPGYPGLSCGLADLSEPSPLSSCFHGTYFLCHTYLCFSFTYNFLSFTVRFMRARTMPGFDHHSIVGT